MIIRKYILGSILLLFFKVSVYTKNSWHQFYNQGIPVMENFYESDYGAEATNYDLTYSDYNYLYVLNPRGILEFDGYEWRLIQRYDASPKDRIHCFNDKIFYIKEDKIGFLYPDKSGLFSDSVLIVGNHLNNSYSKHKIHSTSEKIYFITTDTIYCGIPNGPLTRIPAINNFCASVLAGGRLVVNDYPNGIYSLRDKLLEPLIKHKVLTQHRVFDITAIDSNQFIANIIYKGLYHINNQQMYGLNNTIDYFGAGLKTDNGALLFSTLMYGIVKFNNEFDIDGLLNYSVGLADNNVVDICAGNNNNVWVCTQNGISYMALGMPKRLYNKNIGLPLHIENLVEHKGQIYVCTKNGLYLLRSKPNFKGSINRDSFQLVEEIKGTDAICYEAYSFNGYLLLSTSSGLFIIEDQQAIPLRQYSFKQKPTHKDKLFVKTISGNAIYCYQDNTIKRAQHKPWLFNELVFGKKAVWFADSSFITKVNITSDMFDEQNFELPESYHQQKFHYLFTDSMNLYCALPGRVYTYNEESCRWMVDDSFQSILDTNKLIVKCYYAEGNKTLLLSISDLNEYSNYTTALYKKNNGRYSIAVNLSGYLGNVRINTIYVQSESLWWIGTNDELVAFNPAKVSTTGLNRKVGIRKVVHSAHARTIWLGYGYRHNEVFPYSKGEVTFRFTTNSFTDRKNVKYSYMLEGYQKDWSVYSTNNIVNYTNLREGNYNLYVKAQFRDGYISDAVKLSFKIKPPWYRTYVAYGGYLIALFLIGYLLFKWRLYYIEKDRKRLEDQVRLRTDQLNQSNKELTLKTHELEEMDRVKSNFFANISHELRTPLTLILGPLSNLIGRESNQEKLKEFQVMKRNSIVLKQHIEQFLELSRIESGNFTLHTELVDLDDFLRRVIAAFESLAEIKSVELNYIPVKTGIKADIDVRNMEIVMNNLISNALKFTPKNGIISIQLESNISFAIIRVKDTGIGIESKNVPYIFKRFYQVDTSVSKRYEGTGIGLALTRDIVEMHKGEISVSSTPGKGTEFVVTIPLLEQKEDDTGEPAPYYQEKTATEEPYYTTEDDDVGQDAPLVLVVEDNKDMQNHLKDLLKDRFNVHLAENGEEGLKKAMQLNPHLIVSDVMMPLKDGFTMVDDIRNIPEISHIPIIMLTARADEESKLKGLRKGVEEYLSKPFSKEELLIRISNIVKRRAAIKEKVSKKLVLEPQELELTSLDEQFIIKAGELIEENITNSDFDIQQLSDALNISRRHLHRKIKLLTDMSPSEFVRSYRLKKAAQMLQQKVDSVSQVAYAVGFDDLSYFTKCFKIQFGKTPREFGSG